MAPPFHRTPGLTEAAFAARLADTMRLDHWTKQSVAEAVIGTLGPRYEAAAHWMVAGVFAAWSRPYPPSRAELADLVRHAPGFQGLYGQARLRNRPPPPVTDPPAMSFLPPFGGLGLPLLATAGDVAAWLGLDMGALDWLADPQGRLHRPGSTAHYLHRWVRKRSGGLRLIEAPLPRLKTVQRQILHGLLVRIRPHAAAYGFVRGRSCLMAAQQHAGEAVVICWDLADFFLTVTARRVEGLFRRIGYPWEVAHLLAALTTTRTPAEALAVLDAPSRHRHVERHLPQGAPTSPALANLLAYGLDRRLSALARRVGATYTRYADDLTFSGDRSLAFDGARPVTEIVAEIAAEEGFRLNPGKTRVQRRGRRQVVTGVVVNRHLNPPREAFDRLKAILTNCLRHGPASQNRDGHPAFKQHLAGRIGWIAAINPARGAKLWALYDRIAWDPTRQ